jgi:hypothetical protein
MSDYVKLAAGAADQYLTVLAETQENFLKSVTALAAQMPAAPPMTMPAPAFAVDLPTQREVTEANFAFAAKLLKQQKAFAEKLVATSTPAL